MEEERSQKRMKCVKRNEPKKGVGSSKRIELKKGVQSSISSELKKRMKSSTRIVVKKIVKRSKNELMKRIKSSKRIERKKLVKSSKRSKLAKRLKPLKGSKLKKRVTPPIESKVKEVNTSKQELNESLEDVKRDQIMACLSKRKDMDKKEQDLFKAAKSGSDNGSSIKRKVMDNSKMEQALYKAAKSGDCVKIAEILRLNVSVEVENWNQGIHYEYQDMVKSRPVYSVTGMPRGWRPLHAAAVNGHVKCLQMLIDHGANVDARDKFHCTSLHLAAENGYHECLRALLAAGADCNVPTIDSPGSPYVSGTTALHVAAKYNHVSCVEELLKFSADCNAMDENGHTSLYIAARYGFDQCVLSHLSPTVLGGRDIVSLPSFGTSDTPLHLAVKHRMLDCVKELVRLESDVNHINNDGYSPLHLVISGDRSFVGKFYSKYEDHKIRMEILKYFVLEVYNVDINIPTKKGYTPLEISAVENHEPEMATFIMAYGADINMRSRRPGLGVLEHELSFKEDLCILKCLVNCMLLLPRLKSLDLKYSNFIGDDSVRTEKYAVWHSFILPENMVFRLLRDEADNICVEMRDRKVTLSEAVYSLRYYYHRSASVSPAIRYRLEQPLLNLVYERVLDEIEQLDDILSTDADAKSNFLGEPNHMYQLKGLEKCLWYERMATNPRTLQHCCRFAIRKCMGPSRMKQIKKLPLPQKCLSYLLFGCEE